MCLETLEVQLDISRCLTTTSTHRKLHLYGSWTVSSHYHYKLPIPIVYSCYCQSVFTMILEAIKVWQLIIFSSPKDIVPWDYKWLLRIVIRDGIETEGWFLLYPWKCEICRTSKIYNECCCCWLDYSVITILLYLTIYKEIKPLRRSKRLPWSSREGQGMGS